MKLPKHCQKVVECLQNDLIKDPNKLNEEELAVAIRKHINKHHVPYNALRTFAAIYLYQMARHKGVSREILNKILIYEDQVTIHEVTYSLGRLTDDNIIKEREKGYLISQA